MGREADHSPPTSAKVKIEYVDLFIHSPIRLQAQRQIYLSTMAQQIAYLFIRGYETSLITSFDQGEETSG
jgi:hypothetical protein